MVLGHRLRWWYWLPGLLLSGFGLFFLVYGGDYAMGSMRRIGPGFFPAALSWLLMGLGAAVALEGLLLRDSAPEIHFRPLLMVVAAIILWALSLETFGLYPATFLLVVVSSLAERRTRLWPTLLLALALSLLSHGIFIYGFRLPFQPFIW